MGRRYRSLPPGATGTVPFARPADTVLVFAGAFRVWHGAIHIVTALRELHARGRTDVRCGLYRRRAGTAARAGGSGRIAICVVFTGALAHAQMPACLAACDVGVAPFDSGAHPPLSLGFYWSPLKIFEYMATGLPVVAPAVDRIPELVEHNREGLLYDTAMPSGLPHALEALTDRTLRQRLGRSARTRAVRDYSWSAHCRELEKAIKTVQDSRLAAHDRESGP